MPASAAPWTRDCLEPCGKRARLYLTRGQTDDHLHDAGFRRIEVVAVEGQKDCRGKNGSALVAVQERMVAGDAATVVGRKLEHRSLGRVGLAVLSARECAYQPPFVAQARPAPDTPQR